MCDNSPCNQNTLVMAQAKAEEALAEKAAFVRKVKEAIAEARKFAEEQKVGFVGQRIVDIVERACY